MIEWWGNTALTITINIILQTSVTAIPVRVKEVDSDSGTVKIPSEKTIQQSP